MRLSKPGDFVRSKGAQTWTGPRDLLPSIVKILVQRDELTSVGAFGAEFIYGQITLPEAE